MDFPNPTIIAQAPNSRKAPLFLLHDGGGTIFNYFRLRIDERDVYGIHNARPPPKKWERGLVQMAEEYLKLIEAEMPSGKILLGGWSLGGMVSLQIARLLAERKDSKLRVIGIIMVDSDRPIPPGSDGKPKAELAKIEFDPSVKKDTRDYIQSCMEQADAMIDEWKVPDWPDTSRLPPAVLIRARDKLPPSEQDAKIGADPDSARSKPQLGWEDYGYDFVKNVLDVDGNHYSMFEGKNMDVLDKSFNMACRMLDQS